LTRPLHSQPSSPIIDRWGFFVCIVAQNRNQTPYHRFCRGLSASNVEPDVLDQFLIYKAGLYTINGLGVTPTDVTGAAAIAINNNFITLANLGGGGRRHTGQGRYISILQATWVLFTTELRGFSSHRAYRYLVGQ
jgi:hypothetical protein